MKNVYRRYFRVTSGPVMDFISHANEVNDAAHKQYLEILADIGAKLQYYQRDGKLTGILFEGEPDSGVFKKNGQFGWYPKKNCAKGREIHKRLESVETINPSMALKSVGLSTVPVLFTGGRCYWATLTIIPETPPAAYVSVPWYDEDPAELEKYREERSKGTWGDGNLDHLLWQPSEGMEPVKEWELSRAIDEWNEKVKAA